MPWKASSVMEERLRFVAPMRLSAGETTAFVANETARWRKVIQDAGIKAE